MAEVGGIKDVPPRLLSVVVWHQTRPRKGLLDFSDPAGYDGRYNRAGGPGVWYASLTERGAWAEFLRHWLGDEISPFEVRRRVGRARLTDLAVLDLTDPAIQAQLRVDEAALVGNDWAVCQDLANSARRAGFDGILAPSGALAGESTVVVFAAAICKVQTEHSRIQRPPVRLLRVLRQIRLSEETAATVGRLYEALHSLWHRLGRR